MPDAPKAQFVDASGTPSLDDVREIISAAVRAAFGDGAYPTEIYPTYCIVDIQTKDQQEYYRVSYEVKDGKVELGEKKRIQKVISWVPLNQMHDTRKTIRQATIFADTLQVSYEEQEDGTYTIRDVPIFELGTHRGFDYTEDWARKAVANFRDLIKKPGYKPTVIIGHTKDDKDAQEPPAVGFMENLRLVGKRLVTDFVNIGKEVFDQIKAGMWPYRSIEVYDKAAQITAVALLGGTPPYMKSSPLMFGDEPGTWIHFNAPDEEPGMTPEQITVMQDRIKALEGESATLKADNATLKTRLDTAGTETKERLAQYAEEARRGRIKEFIADIRGLGVAPAIIDSPEFQAFTQTLSGQGVMVKFADGEKPGLEALQKFIAIVADQAKKNAVIVPGGDRAQVVFSDPPQDSAPVTEADRARYGQGVDPETIATNKRATEAVASGAYNHLPEPLRYRQALMDITR